MNEKEMRESAAPWPNSLEELNAYITSLTTREHEYGTCVYAMSLAATATFQYVAKQLGASGFQASCADLDVLRRTRSIDGPFMLLCGHDMLYPQYNLPEQLRTAMVKWQGWAAKEAKEKMAKNPQNSVHPDVWAHWERLAARAEEKDNG